MMINTPNKEHKRAIEMAINKLGNYATEKKLMQDTFLAECVNDHENRGFKVRKSLSLGF